MTTTERPDLSKLCGLKEQPSSGTAWHEIITAGLPARGIRATARAIGVKDCDLCELLGVAESVLEDKEQPLARDVSNFLYRIALALTRTIVRNGGNVEAAATWLRSAQPTIKGYIPILLLQSHIGTEYVFTAIERLEAPKDKVIHQEEAPDAGTAEFEHQFGDEVEDDEDNPFANLGDDE